jgi:hypothetical protein
MNTVTIGVSDLDRARQRMAAAFRGEPQGSFLSFASIELLWDNDATPLGDPARDDRSGGNEPARHRPRRRT